jgi:hypothetical protein
MTNIESIALALGFVIVAFLFYYIGFTIAKHRGLKDKLFALKVAREYTEELHTAYANRVAAKEQALRIAEDVKLMELAKVKSHYQDIIHMKDAEIMKLKFPIHRRIFDPMGRINEQSYQVRTLCGEYKESEVFHERSRMQPEERKNYVKHMMLQEAAKALQEAGAFEIESEYEQRADVITHRFNLHYLERRDKKQTA